MTQNHLFSLKGKTALITGAAGYFGENFTKSLLEYGSKVILFDQDDKLAAFARSLQTSFDADQIECYQVDCYDENAFKQALNQAASNNAHIDVLINNAFEFSKNTGFNDPSGKMETISKDQWMRCLDSGIYWHALASQIIAAKMKLQKKGSIINISSMYAVVSPDPALYKGKKMFNPPCYSVSKAGLLAFTRYVASFYGEFGIRCNAILAGAFPHVGIESNSKVDDQEFLDRLAGKTILGRVGQVADLIGPLLFLASDASQYITGQGISVDGGWTVR
ncbi:MAG: SDR family oxidoreductase [Deltaproteobacteria bacterium]|nr:SDR family oxidoreductase [Deltaproteobacteria bacterium]